jgi:ADP-ribosylglycohydrolase/fructose-1,6-bisphosphatase/inositol monophosphatase family enzyme
VFICIHLWLHSFSLSFHYQHALETAIQAAREAGALLLAEWHREGGARGPMGKAPADVEAEKLIRARLLEEFPAHGYRGEETGERPADEGEPHLWLVDPNDGTTSFQRGRRGPAVSIALLRDQIPVLGVVFAYAAPDDKGDLFAWAEGRGPLSRNGKAVATPEWKARQAAPLQKDDVVLLSQGSDRRVAQNSAAVSPARFRAVPSIAYRLALVAAGEGVATVSLNAPGDWDYAAGHALLRAVGGVLLNERGEEITYAANGRSTSKFCFGGAPKIARELAQRNWDLVFDPYDSHHPYDYARLQPGKNISDAAVLSRAQGCLLGQLCGDALGSAVEGYPAEMAPASHPGKVRRLTDGGLWETIAGQPTDDSELALMLARSILQAGCYDPESAAQAYSYWYESKPFGMGRTTHQALSAISRGDLTASTAAEKARNAADPNSQANGSLMRASPLGIWGWRLSPDELASHARADSALTHPHPACQDACVVFTIAIAHAIRAGTSAREVHEHTLAWAKKNAVEMPVRVALIEAMIRPPQDYSGWNAGWVLTALRNAFFQLLHAPNLEEGIVRSVLAGGDTDTNAAIAGALLGAVYGREAVPHQWRQMVLTCRPHDGDARVHHPRPRAFWPADALELAEMLLL